ncbi:hypothetical protein DPMN_058629 [Dreissena polymorpha]|uniref:Uncharacterized protein n=1 Tax=Dreissena polymorpha TaxID=45954 RepID=A0A9D4C240_DREPO|nr:hypothetical protein DPMN_058629 [Dreissena polymorpha]
MGAVLPLLEAKYLTDSHKTWHYCSAQCASMSEVSPTLIVTSLTFKRKSKWQLMASAARSYDV